MIIELIIMSKMTEPVIQLLKGKNFAHLSTLMNDGSPKLLLHGLILMKIV
jgi:hypothetical protein